MSRVDIIIDGICDDVNVICDHFYVTRLYFRPLMVSSTGILLPNGWAVHLGMSACMIYMPHYDDMLALQNVLQDA